MQLNGHLRSRGLPELPLTAGGTLNKGRGVEPRRDACLEAHGKVSLEKGQRGDLYNEEKASTSSMEGINRAGM